MPQACISEVIFVGLCGPESVVAEAVRIDARPQVAAQQVQMSLVDGLDLVLSERLSIVSSLPVGDFPSYPRVIVKGGKWSHNGTSQNILCGFINFIVIKHLTRSVTVFCGLLKKALVSKRRANRVDIILYSLNSAQLISTILGARFYKSSRLFIIIPDLPQFMDSQPSQPFWKRFLKWIDRELIYRIVKRADGLIVFTDAIAQEIAPLLPRIIMEGVVSESALHRGLRRCDNERSEVNVDKTIGRPLKIGYAGSLVYGYGVELLIECIEKTPNLFVEIHVYGQGPLEQMCRSADVKFDKFHYHGFMSPDQLLGQLLSMDVLVSLRDPEVPISRYAFPSKILEYMSTGVPVLTTKIPCLKEEYLEKMFVLDDYSCAGLSIMIEYIIALPLSSLHSLGHRARRFVRDNKTGKVQAQRLLKFIDSFN